jgi:hypothetical protein
MKYLKARLIILSMMFSTVSLAQHQHDPVQDVLRNKTTQDSIMTAICQDQGMMDNMMKHMMQNNSAMHQMMSNREMMDRMAKEGGRDSSMCKQMMAGMNGDKGMHGMMMENKMTGDSTAQNNPANKEHQAHH